MSGKVGKGGVEAERRGGVLAAAMGDELRDRGGAVGGGVEMVAVVQFGPASASLMIGEREGGQAVRPLEYLERPLTLARDIYRMGEIGGETIEAAAAAVRGFQKVIGLYGVGEDTAHYYTTNLLAEAENNEIFLNRMQAVSGADVELIDDGAMTRLLYLGIRRLVTEHPDVAEGKTLVFHVGPGNTRVLLFRHGRIASYQSYRLGVHRSLAMLGQGGGKWDLELLSEALRGVIDQIFGDYGDSGADLFVVTGVEIQQVAGAIGVPGTAASRVKVKELEAAVRTAGSADADAVVRRFGLPYSSGESLRPSLAIHHALMRRFGMGEVLVPGGDFQREFLADLLAEGSDPGTLSDEVLQSARSLLRKYKGDMEHALHVAMLGQQLFQSLGSLHRLGAHYELLLRVSAILHEVGMFVSPKEHHKHSLYVIAHSEIFGLSESDLLICGLVARYHRRYGPDKSHPHYRDLSRHRRMVVLKLAALLRVADSLDRSHVQRVKQVKTRVRGRDLLVECEGVEDLTVEQLAIHEKGGLFEELFGCRVVFVPDAG
jgi:exopolyphosphatase / guanosine-5'-triphosphate,3'-diphosphate pyrophosphatase